MYRLACITAIFCTLLLPFAPATAHARASGRLYSICYDFKINGYKLSATCRKIDGFVETASIDLTPLVYWKYQQGCPLYRDNCYQLSWGQPNKADDIFFNGNSYSESGKKKFDELNYGVGIDGYVTLWGRGCYHFAPFNFTVACSSSGIMLFEHIDSENGKLFYVP